MSVVGNRKEGKYTVSIPYGERGSKEREAWLKKADELSALFRSDLEKENETAGLSKTVRDRMYQMATDAANSSFETIANYEELADLARMIRQDR